MVGLPPSGSFRVYTAPLWPFLAGITALATNDNEECDIIRRVRGNDRIVALVMEKVRAASTPEALADVFLFEAQLLVIRHPDQCRIAWLMSECFAAIARERLPEPPRAAATHLADWLG